MSSFLKNLEWRSAVKSFVAKSRVSPQDLEQIKGAIHMAPSSFGLQPYYVIAVQDDLTKKQLRKSGWDQPQLENCDVVFVFVARTDISARITEFVQLIKSSDPVRTRTIDGYEKMIRSTLEGKTKEELKSWASKQIYIALGFALAACAELKVSSCPMEGFIGPEFDKILKLPETHYATVALAVGIPDPAVAISPKLRFPLKDIVRNA